MSAASGKGSMPPPSAGSGAEAARPSETPKDLKKRVRGLDKSLTSVHERLVQTERQIFDLERSYLEETRLYGNVLQGWDAYLDTKGKGKGKGKGGASRGAKRETSDDGELEGEGSSKRTKGVELEERLFSLGSVTSPATKSLQKLEEAKIKAAAGGVSASGGGAGAGVGPKTPREKRTYMKRTTNSSKKDSSTSKKKRR